MPDSSLFSLLSYVDHIRSDGYYTMDTTADGKDTTATRYSAPLTPCRYGLTEVSTLEPGWLSP